jgi:alpha-N-arabinofuranosidase
MRVHEEDAMAGEIRIDPAPGFDLSPYLYMQLLEPLGATDGSVDAAWDRGRNRWRQDFIAASRELSPTLIRWPGGCFSSYYRWKEGVGPRDRRRPAPNILWGGIDGNQVGTHEYIEYCRLIGADPLIAVNFESDGRPHWATFAGRSRSGSPSEAAAWVDYCNNPANRLRRRNGAARPFDVRLWQIGNETSYDPKGYDCETAARRTAAFARAMRKADPRISLIGWGDSGWARRMLEVAGQSLDYVAFHHHFTSGIGEGPRGRPSPLAWGEYRTDPARTWKHLMNASRITGEKIEAMRREVAGFDVKLAMTESHFSAPGRNRCDVLSTWAAGVAYARVLNVHERNGDILKIATLDDFCGVRWMTCAILIQQPGTKSYLLPVARVMSLFRRHRGSRAATVLQAPPELDVTASRTARRLYLHVANTSRTKDLPVTIVADGMRLGAGRAWVIAEEPTFEVDPHNDGRLAPVERAVARGKLVVPRASVAAVEVALAAGR